MSSKASINKQVQELEMLLAKTFAERDANKAACDALSRKLIEREAEHAAIVAKMNADSLRAEINWSRLREDLEDRISIQKAALADAALPWWKRLFSRRPTIPLVSATEDFKCPSCGKTWEHSILDACSCWVEKTGGPKKMPLMMDREPCEAVGK